ncbi:MAG: iron export ABC transporter permease subunit FetB [Gammaproteobacteria bacterium]|nr:iron export ABC transporter permease subunit FetB [Gammaproteobacteria bacterium]
MNLISLTTFDLALASVLILLLALLSFRMQLGISRTLLIAALRTTAQLALIGLVLKYLFDNVNLLYISIICIIMLLVAGYEVMSRQQRRFLGGWGYGVGTLSMFISSFSITLIALHVIIGNDPWYQPQYAIPLLGMMLGNTMNGIALGLDRLSNGAWQQKSIIEARLMLGHSWHQAIAQLRHESMRVGMIPMINAMAAAGIVSLPGMMTGQILAGAPPMEAVKYQILIMFLVTAGTGFGTLAAVWLGAKRLFDDRERLRLDRLSSKE